MNKQTKRRRRKGQALLEASLLFLVFFVMMIGMLDVGQMLFLHAFLVDRTWTAARWGRWNPYDPTTMTNLVLYGKTSPADGDQPFWGMSSSNVTVTNPGCGPNPNIDCRVTIAVSGYTYNLFSAAILGKYFGGSGNGTFTGQTITVSFPSELANATQ